MELIENLPQEIRSVVRGFCSHPIADTLRPHMFDYKVYSDTLATQTYPDANIFYLYFFTNKLLVKIISAVKRIEGVGAEVRISEWSLRPKLWPLYEQAFPNYFEEQPDTPYVFSEEDWVSESEVEDDIETN